MGFDLGHGINSAADWLCHAPIVRSIVGNPVITALTITALLYIIYTAMYRKQVAGTGFKRGARTFVYSFLVVLGVVFLHYYSTAQAARSVAVNQGVRDVFTNIEQNRAMATGGAGYGAQSPALGPRPDNVAARPVVLDGGLVIQDVTVPSMRYAEQ